MPEAMYIRQNRRLIRSIEQKVYFSAAVAAYNQELSAIKSSLVANGVADEEAQKQSEREILSHLHDVMRAAQPLVEELINSRIASGAITNADQARKSAAGNIFQQLFAYSLAKNVLNGNIASHVIVSTSVASVIDQYAAIAVGDDVQKPDSDVIVYSDEQEDSPIINFSCKTSCRERAGQTYKWKLLCDLATCRCEHKNENENCPATKYQLAYTPVRDIKMCFVTTDFYDELNNPQISAMFNFFDHSYVAKTVSPANNISILKNVTEDIDTIFQ